MNISRQEPPEWIFDGDPDAAFDEIAAEMDQIDRLDDDLQRLRRWALGLKCIAVALIAFCLLLGRPLPGAAAAVMLAGIPVCWVTETFLLRRLRLESRLQRDILKGAPPAADLAVPTLAERFPDKRMRLAACFWAPEVFGFYGPFLTVALLLWAFSRGMPV